MSRPGPKIPPLSVTDAQRAVLEGWVRRRTTAQALAQRSRVVLECAEGHSIMEVSRRLRIAPDTVRTWRQRFIERGLDGLCDDPRPGVPRKISDADVERVIVRTLEETPKNATHWSTRSMAAATGMSHLILDNYATHKTPDIKKWLPAHPRFRLHFTPTSASWLNLVERWFAKLTTKKLKRGVHRSIQALERDIRAWLAGWNEHPRPFVWTKTADEILDKVAAYCRRISDSHH
ncbi:helix-turn-helix domain-containing protein [Streptomyces sp. NPDC056361]|uniref:helix-turn-helix domain-containing protein n=1 Tax=Streptomyces sp. NPDC056361 TaxID=3345795 RepID=UPI0035DAE886